MNKEEMKARERALGLADFVEHAEARAEADVEAYFKRRNRETIYGYAPGIILIVLGLLKFLWDWVTS